MNSMIVRRPIWFFLISMTMMAARTSAQEMDLTLYHRQDQGNIQIYADNHEYYPVTVMVTPQVTNVDIDPNFPNPAIVPPRSDQVLISQLIPKAGKSWKFNYSFQSFPGDIIHTRHSPESPYRLPYDHKKSYVISQGYHGKISHQGEYALDFDMPEKTPVLAARSGIVTDVVDKHNRSCPDESCNQFNNFIRVLHNDGTFAEYAHLVKDGSRISRGDSVEAGDLIGLSGKTGWTTGPHLHFVVYQLIKNGRESIPTEFQLKDGSVVELREGVRY